jgi:hypothetical protein
LLDVRIELWFGALVAEVPPLRGRRAADGAEEEASHSGRGDGIGKRPKKKTQEHIQEWLYYKRGELFVGEGFYGVDAGGADCGDCGTEGGTD